MFLHPESKEYVFLPVDSPQDLSAQPVEVSFTRPGEDPDEWHDAEWDNGSARVLVGPDTDIELEPGPYRVWVRVTDNPEIPVLRGGVVFVR